MATQLDSGPPDWVRPTGTVAFLFTDIEESAQRWEAHREAMDDAVKRHDVVLRDAIDRHNGYVFKTVGDAFCVAFARVSDAVAAACDVQRALSAQDFSAVGGLSIRIGLHAGEASERNGDYFGPAVNRVARLMAIGHGGIGKTRLALQVGADVLDRHPDGVWLIDFAPITDPELVSSVIAKEIGMPQVEG